MKQAQALAVMLRGDSVFLTGPAGSGKTYILNQFISQAKRQGKQVAITASTGIAATHIGGTTIHSWSGLGIRERLTEHDKAWLQTNATLVKRYNSTDVLIIDEVSMLHGARLDMVNQACKILRTNDAPFGGLQIILTGDLFQLPPVNREGGDDDFAHTSAAWRELDPQICYLTEQHRQTDDDLITILTAMRQNTLTQGHFNKIKARIGLLPPENEVVTKLYSHNIDVESINQQQLEALPGESRTFQMATGGRAQYVEQLVKSVLAPETLELKVGAEVMFVANNFAAGFVNGSRGQVVGFRGEQPIIRLQTGREVTLEPHNWVREEDGREIARVTQLPLRLAWAITIHKSQGMSLDSALIDLSRSFTYGMGYVALSRVRSIEGLYLHGLNQRALQLHPDIYEFDQTLQTKSAALAELVGDVPDVASPTPEATAEVTSPIIDEVLVAKLRAWRFEKAQAAKQPPYIIAHNTLLDQLAIAKPLSNEQLLAMNGFGPRKLEAYGQELLQIISDHVGEPIKNASNIVIDEWDITQDEQLLALFKAGESLEKAANLLKKSPEMLWKRLQMLVNQPSLTEVEQ